MKLLAMACFLCALLPATSFADAMDRINLQRLRATHEQVQTYQSQLSKVQLESGYDDVRAILHAHSYLSHDSVGTIKEIIAAAHATNVQVIMFSNHPAPSYDYFKDTEQGMHDGVLLLPGAETGGLLVYPTRSMNGQSESSPQAFVDVLHQDGGLTFVSHLEERLDWELDRLTGNEIYNTHADVMEEKRFLTIFKEPMRLLQLLPALQQFPQETFAAVQDYPTDYLRTWDRWCQRAPHTGVAANDSHHNQAYRAVITEDGKIRLEDGVGQQISLLDPAEIPALKFLIGDRKPGDKVLEIDLDPYDRSFRHVSTHLLINTISRDAVWDALQNGRAYVAFDWMADPTGFVYQAVQRFPNEDQTVPKSGWPIGSQLSLADGLRLEAEAALPVAWKLLRDGEVINESSGRSIDIAIDKAGVYRVEAWLKFLDERRPWILSNPIYVRPQEESNQSAER